MIKKYIVWSRGKKFEINADSWQREQGLLRFIKDQSVVAEFFSVDCFYKASVVSERDLFAPLKVLKMKFKEWVRKDDY